MPMIVSMMRFMPLDFLSDWSLDVMIKIAPWIKPMVASSPIPIVNVLMTNERILKIELP